MKKFIFVIGIFTMIGITNLVYADIVINEIAWMGTKNSANEEWVELYNSGNASVSVDGWNILNSKGVMVNLEGEISPGEYFLICRTTPSVTNPLNGICDINKTFSGSGLNNENDQVILKNESGQTIQSVSSGSKWANLGGNNTTKETAQRTDSNSWVTAEPTPGSKNKQVSSSSGSTGSSGGSSGSQNNLDDDEILLDSDSEKKKNEDTVKEIVLNPEYASKMLLPEIFVQQVPAVFDTEIKYRQKITKLKGKFEWSMGDGGYFLSHESKPFTYAYQEPGEYVISMRYYSSIFNEEPDTLHQKTITVLPAKTNLVRRENGTIAITNTTSGTLDIGDWKLVQNNAIFIIPKFTVVKSGATIQIPQRVHNFPINGGIVSLFTPLFYFSSSEIVPQKTISSTRGGSNALINSASANFDESQVLYQPPMEQVTTQLSKERQPFNYWIFIFIAISIGSVVIHMFLIAEKDSEEKDNPEKI
jgi:hypothetical protein